VRVNVAHAKTELFRLLARLARVAPATPGSRFLAADGRIAGSIKVGDDFEFSEAEIDAILDDPQ
jgi:hypothetical protein